MSFVEVVNRTGVVKSFDGTEISYETFQPKEIQKERIPLVLCYGLVCATTHWRYQVSYFKSIRQCVLLDYRGHHKSGMPALEAVTVENCAHDVLAVMDDLGIQKAHLAGHSMGSHVALLAARMHPERVASITSVCASAESPFETMFHTSLFRHVFDVIKTLHGQKPERVEELWHKAVANNALNRAVVGMAGFNRKLATSDDVGIYLEGVQKIPFLVFKALLDDMSRNPLLPLLHDIQTPTLIVSGEKDFIQPSINQKKMYENLPRAQWLSIPFGSHCAHVDMHEFVNLRMEKFMNEQDPS